MRIFFRGSTVNFSTEFLDDVGAPANVATATMILMYPDEGSNSAPKWPLNGDDLTRAEVTLTEQDDNSWTGTWDSRVSQPGQVYWTVYTDDSGTAWEDGVFRLRGNFANLEVLPA